MILIVEAALTADHPRFYAPPRAGAVHAYARLYVRIRGSVAWVREPLPKRASDASGELDYGDLGSWWTDGAGVDHTDGERGEILVRDPQQIIEVAPSDA